MTSFGVPPQCALYMDLHSEPHIMKWTPEGVGQSAAWYIVMANIVMANIVVAHIVMANIVMAYVVVAHIVVANIVVAHIVMAYIVMTAHHSYMAAHHEMDARGRGQECCMAYSYGPIQLWPI